MERIPFLVHYGGVWTEEFDFVSYEVNGLLVDKSVSFMDFKQIISENIKVNEDQEFSMEFQISPKTTPIQFCSAMNLSFYFHIRSGSNSLNEYPVCVSIFQKLQAITEAVEKSMDLIEHQVDLEIEHYGCFNSINHDDHALYLNNIKETVLEEIESISNDNNDDDDDDQDSPEILGTNKPAIQSIFVGQVFENKETLKDAISLYALENNFQFKCVKSCPKELHLICTDESCCWLFKASRNKKTGSFIMRKYVGDHSCTVDNRNGDKRQATRSIIAKFIKDTLMQPKIVYTSNNVITDVRKRLGVDITYQNAWQSREIAFKMIMGSALESFSMLPRCLYILQETNPGTVVKLETDNDRFKYLFFAIHASIKGWDHCHPVVVVDATFLKSCFGGTLIAASTPDAQGMVFPLAFAVVDSENDNSWTWFFEQFIETYKEREGMIIISDRHKSIEKACKTVIPNIPHCICTYHLLQNLKGSYKTNIPDMTKYFKHAYKAYTEKVFEKNMKQLDNINCKITECLREIGFEKWTRIFSPRNRYSSFTSNIDESLNSMIKAAKHLPITSLVEYLVGMVQDLFYKNRNRAIQTRTVLTRRHEKLLEKQYIMGSTMEVRPSTGRLVCVCNGDRMYIVDLDKKTCSCKRFQYDEIPCAHALAHIKKFNLISYDYCSKFYTKEKYMATYNEIVNSLPDKTKWIVSEEVSEQVIKPPNVKVRAGRPRKERYKSYWEEKTKIKVKCSYCGKFGHNRRTCGGARLNN